MEGPTRTCLACRQQAAKPSLIRLASADGTVQVDPDASLQARGAYVCATQECARAALRGEGAAIARALRTGRDAVDIEALRTALDRAVTAHRAPRAGGGTVTPAMQPRRQGVAVPPPLGVCA
jgi:predicted RNA-binding protein YlxR (DUF448 family)